MATFTLSSLLPMILFFLSLNKVYLIESTSFSFNKFVPVPQQPDLILQGDALISANGRYLPLTDIVPGSVGRALYAAPIHIWDNETGQVASFTTSFSFCIFNDDLPKAAEGLAFFLAPVNTQPQNSGGLLGLFPDETDRKSHHVVAVEFDTHTNEWDPQGPHIGINVNGIKSVKTTPWNFDSSIEESYAVISYQASTKLLTASLVHPSTQTSYIVSYVVDLKDVLPEFVRVGFSASTGLNEGYIELNFIYSWSFDSNLPSTC